jgi:hypothetical protein
LLGDGEEFAGEIGHVVKLSFKIQNSNLKGVRIRSF